MRNAPRPRLHRLRSRRLVHVILILTVALIIYLLDRNGLLLADRPDADRYDGASARVVRIVDGDTLIVDLADPLLDTATTRIRLWGIDCPEMARSGPEARPAQPFAQQATDLATTLALDVTVTMRIERHRIRGKYNRILAHVDLPDGSSLAEQLLLAGLARADDRWTHTLLVRYERLEFTAKKNHAGIWHE